MAQRKTIEIVADYEVRLKDIGVVAHTYKIKTSDLVQLKETITSGSGDYDVSIGQLEKLTISCVVADEHASYFTEAGRINDAELDLIEVVKDGSEARGGVFEAVGVLDIKVNDSERKGKKEITLEMVGCASLYHSIDGVPVYDIDHRVNRCIIGDVDVNAEVNRILGR
jgi:hypothetical protein